MKNERIFFPGTFRVEKEEVEVPARPDAGKILVRNYASIISPGTELSLYTGIHSGLKDPNNTWAKFPFYPGYSAAGEVIAVGEGVENFSKGDRVVHLGTHEALTHIAATDASRIPENLSYERACASVFAYISLQGVRLARIQLGEKVLLAGLGIIGQFALQFARLSGGRIIALDLSAQRLSLAKKAGALHIINPEKSDALAEIKKLTQGRGAEAVIEATGNPKVVPLALKLTAEMGRFILLGSPRGAVELDLYPEIHCRGISVIGAHVDTSPRSENQYTHWTRAHNWGLALELMARDELKVDYLITHRLRPDGVDEKIYDGLLKKKEEFLGVVIKWV